MELVLTLAHCWEGHAQTGMSLVEIATLVGGGGGVGVLAVAIGQALRPCTTIRDETGGDA